MKLKIKVKVKDGQVMPTIISKGDWIDLPVYLPNESVGLNKGQVHKFDFGVAMELPKGFEAVLLPRSSTFKNTGLMLCNSQGVIDGSFNGDNDYWQAMMIKMQANSNLIQHKDRLCQFRIQLSQKATFLQKLKWLFCSGIELVKVKELNAKSRGGYGTTGR